MKRPSNNEWLFKKSDTAELQLSAEIMVAAEKMKSGKQKYKIWREPKRQAKNTKYDVIL